MQNGDATRVTLRNVRFGDPTAEGDTRLLFDQNCFLETDIFQQCLSLEAPLFITGRRGSGKTALHLALRRRFVHDSSILVTIVTPQPFHFAHTKALSRLLMREADLNWEFLFTSAWATTLRGEWARQLLTYYRVRDTELADLHLLEQFVEDVGAGSGEPEARLAMYLQRAASILASEAKDPIGEINHLLASSRSERVTQSIRRVAESSGVRLVTLIDGLDENWDGSNASAQLVSGLLTQAAADYPPTGVVSYLFIRENMYRRVSQISPRWDRIEAYFCSLLWNEQQLEQLIGTRISKSLENPSIATWDAVFEPYVDSVPTASYILRRTQFKPREAILFCNYALQTALRRRAQCIRAVDILEAEGTYSANRLRDLINEYQDSIPELGTLIEIFAGGASSFTLDELFRRLSEFIAAGRYAVLAPRLSLTHPNREAILDLLLGLGFLGVRLRHTSGFVFKYYGEQGNVFHELDEIDELTIHPAFAGALGLRPHTGAASLKEASDEDIIAVSQAVAIRATAASEMAFELLARRQDIPTGMGGFRRYEEITRDSVAFAFGGYLDNGRIQERTWSGTQIRDIIFDNTGETTYCQAIRNRFNALTVVFECKNKVELEPADFNQIETQLNDATGNLGFVCYRANRTEPKRSEIEHLRSIYHRSKGTKIVLLFPDPKWSQVFDRRLKGKLDRFLFRWLTSYLSLYLSP